MRFARSAVFCLISSWIVACATAQDNNVPGDGTGATGAGANGGFGSGGSNGIAGSNGAFGGSGALPGTSGSTGTGGHAGAVGKAGAGGGANAGSGGKAGAGGAGGGGGMGGSAPVFEAGECAANPTMSLSYKQTNTGQQITGQYQFTNQSDTPIPVGSLKIRYFFTNEHTKGWSNTVYDSKIEGGTGGYRKLASTTLAEGPVSPPLDGADTYAEVSFAATATLEKGATATVSWDMQPNGYDAPFQVQANDYSFNAADTEFTPWDHIAIYQGDTLVFGCLPKSLAGGTGGAGGSGGASSAGAGGLAGSSAAGSSGTAGASGLGGAGGVSGASSGGSAGAGGATSAGSGGVAGSGGTAGST